MARWRLKDAQKKLPEILEKADREGPQTITVAPGRSYVLQATKRPTRKKIKKNTPNLLRILLDCPKGPPLHIERDRTDTVGYGDPPVFD